ncbi:serine hydrolase [Nonomuraea sp. KC401]|uniref:serine hydrolase n=1 Tax=unclassified Nonomuraea TaxID=2593643 RepID=UPI0010FCFBC1|nr:MULTISPECIES: serine hydrolase [unclassified Nonomuraea]NBE99818.1 serine hydrolase [Nonomuraea sp. K271]TLF55492.1 serine hydrolase [Nonomuraea sp. KC401]
MHASTSRFARAVRRLNALCDAQPYVTGWCLIGLPTSGSAGARAGARAGVMRADRHGTRAFPAASTRKVAVMMAALRAVHRGELDLDTRLTIDGRYRDRVFTGLLQHLDPGLSLSLRDAVTLMIIQSDNLSTAHVLDLVGLDAVNDLCASAGLDGTRHRHALIPELAPDHPVDASNVTTPADQARLLELITHGSAAEPEANRLLGCPPELCSFALDVLCRQQFRDTMPAFLPYGTKIAHKSGAGWRDVSDGGVFFGDDGPRYVLTVYTDELPAVLPDGLPGFSGARVHIAHLSRACWEEMHP